MTRKYEHLLQSWNPDEETQASPHCRSASDFLPPPLSAGVAPAAADLKLCNTTTSRVGVAIGYKDETGWVSEGWWNVASQTCEVLLKGSLVARYYYIHALDYDRGGEWGGKANHVHGRPGFHDSRCDDCHGRAITNARAFSKSTHKKKKTGPSDLRIRVKAELATQ